MVWLTFIIVAVPILTAALIMLLWLRSILLGQKISHSWLKIGVQIIFAIYVLQLGGKIILYIFELKESPLGTYLLLDSSFIWRSIFNIALPYGRGLIFGLILLGIAYLLFIYYRKPVLELSDGWLLFITTFVLGYPNFLISLVATLVIMVVFQILQLSIFRSSKRLSISPFLLGVTVVILVLSNFAFYQSLIEKLRL